MDDLKRFGWNDHFAACLAEVDSGEALPGRVVMDQRSLYTLISEQGEVTAATSGYLRHKARGRHELPVIGDWVTFRPARPQEPAARIKTILPRQTRISRKVAGEKTREQVLAANVDTVLLIMGLDADFSLRRMERMLIMAWESGAKPVAVLTKSDLSDDVEARRAEIESVAPGVPVKVVSSKLEDGLEEVRPLLAAGETFVLVGSSGVGKSTLVNGLAGEELMRTGDVRESDGTGRHTTSHRELLCLPDGSLLIDSPGIRELQLWSTEEGLDDAFEDIVALAAVCHFRDCGHDGEPGCAVAAAVVGGKLAQARLDSYRSLNLEQVRLSERQSQWEHRRQERRLGKLYKTIQKEKDR